MLIVLEGPNKSKFKSSSGIEVEIMFLDLRPLRISTKESSTNTMHIQFPNSTLPLNPTRERTRVETQSTHTNPW